MANLEQQVEAHLNKSGEERFADLESKIYISAKSLFMIPRTN
ncbi:MAG: hypothetical protein ACYS8Y_13550 [Planctomycetota bacterium]|jgi:hypothetical protein